MAGDADFEFSFSEADTAAVAQARDNSEAMAPIPQGGAPVLSETAQTSFGNAITYGFPGVIAGLMDTLGQSLGVLHDDTVPNFLKSYTGDGENSFGDFYARNQQPLRTGGEVAGMLLPGLTAMKVLKSVKFAREAGTLGEVARDSKALNYLLGTAANLSTKEAAIAAAAIDGAEAQGVWAGRSVATPAVNAAKRSYYAARAVDAARTTVAFELGSRIGFNSSDTFYPADYTLTDQLKWGVGGLAVGGVLDLVAAKYAVRNLVQTALNGYGKQAAEYGTLASTAAGSPYAASVTSTIFRPGDRGVGITQYAALSADLKDTANVSKNATLKTNLAQDQTNIKSVLVNQVKAMAYDTHPILPRTILDEAQVNLALDALGKNNTTLLFAKKLTNVPETGAADFYTSTTKILEKAKTEYNTDVFRITGTLPEAEQPAAIRAAEAKIAPIEAAANEIHYVLENDGSFQVYKNRADNWLDNNTFEGIKRKTYTTPVSIKGVTNTMKNSKLMVKADNEIVLHDNFRYEMPAGATPKDYSALYAAGSKMIADYKPVEFQEFILTPEVNWRTTEMTIALAEKYPDAMSKIKLGGEFKSLADAKFHVLDQKFKEFQELMPSVDKAPVTGLRARILNSKFNMTPAQVMQRLNLPLPLGFAPSPMIETFAHAKIQNMKTLTEMFPVTQEGIVPKSFTSYDLLQAHLRETLGTTNPKQIIPTSGTLLSQKDVKPLFVSATSTPYIKRADAVIAGMVEAKRDVQLERLGRITPKESPLVSGVIAKIITEHGPQARAGEAGVYTGISEGGDMAGGANQARAVQTLQDGMLSGSGNLVYQDRINEQFPTLKAAQLIAQDTDKFVDNYVSELAKVNLTPRYAQIVAPKNKAHLLDFNRVEQSYRHGWDVFPPEPAPTGDGFVFRLKEDSNINNQLKSYHFGGDVDEAEGGFFMPDMSVTALKSGYTPLTVSKDSAAMAQAISDMSRQSGKENNSLRIALGKNPITIRDFHLPTPELSRTGTWFVRNDTGNVIATYSGDLAASNEKRAKDAAQKLIELSGSTHTAVPLDNVARDHAIFDDNFFNVIDYSDQLAKTGHGIKGGLARTEVDTTDATIKAMVRSLQQQYLNIGVRSRAAIFEPELNYARQAAQTNTRDKLSETNIFDRYISTMFSQSPNNSKGIIGNAYGGLENALDKSLSWLSAYHTELLGGEANTVAAKTMRTLLRKQSSEEEFAQFKKVLPEWNPINDTTKWAESTFREKMPWTARPIMAQLSKVSSTLALRFLDVGTAINNFAGLMTNAPSVVYAMRRLPTESHEQWVNRTAAWGTQLVDGISTFSPGKAMQTSIKAYWNGELTEAMTNAAKHGYFEPEYAALAKVLTKPLNSASNQKIDTFVEHASYLADHSEILSRKLAWGMGYKIGKDLHGFKDERNAYIFANNFVNDMIGNYSPNNKPAMFQGAIGLPLGAFQTYMFNFYRRFYGMVERQDKAGLIAQYAAQASLFGAKSVPGYQAWNSFFQSDASGADDFQSRIDRGMSPGVSELLLNGSLAGIPKIFGAKDSLAFYTRGSVDFTNIPPTVMDWQKAPPIQFLTGTYQGVKATLNNIFSNESFSVQQQEEILARFSTNRSLKSIMEMAADAKTDATGNVIQAGTQDAIHAIAGIMGTQPASTRRLQDASNRERAVQLNQQDARATLNDKTRALFRGGEFDISDLQGMVHDYTRSGGNPAYLGEWLRNSFTTSMTPKAYTKMQELARSGKLVEFENMLAAIQHDQDPSEIKKGK